MRRMERQAQQTDRAIDRLGQRLDTVGTPEQRRATQAYGNDLESLGARARGVDRDSDRMERTFRRVERRTGSLGQAFRRLGATLIGLGAILRALKIPAFAVAIGVAAQAIGALAGGIVALVPRVMDLSGALAPAIAGVTGLGIAMATVKLAFSDVGKALGGNEKALKRLTPEARRFVTTLKTYQPVLKDIRQAAQEGLFPGLEYSLRRAQRAVPMVRRIVGQYGRTLGGLAADATRQFTTPEALRDISAIANQGRRIIDRLGHSLIDVAHALIDVAIAARPFTNWLTDLVRQWAHYIRVQAQAGRDSGRLAAFFRRTRESLTTFGHILRNVWQAFQGLMRAARPLGDELWRSAERATAGWARFTQSIGGQLQLATQLDRMGDSVREILGLVGDLVRAIWRMGASPALPGLARQLRQLVPILERVLTNLANTFGPGLADALVSLGRLLDTLTAQSGPLTIFLDFLTQVFDIINGLIKSIPGLGRILTEVLSVVLVTRFILAVRGLATAWLNVARSAGIAAGAERAAMAGVPLGRGGYPVPVGYPGRGGRPPVTATPPVGDLRRTAMATGAGAALARGGLLRGLLGRGGLLLGGLGRFAWPIAAAGGVLGAATAQRRGGFGAQALQTVYGGLQGLTFGGYGAALRAAGVRTPDMPTPQEEQGAATRRQEYRMFFGDINRMGGTRPSLTKAQLQEQTQYIRSTIAQERNVRGDLPVGQGGRDRAFLQFLQRQLTLRRQVLQTIRETEKADARMHAVQRQRDQRYQARRMPGRFGLAIDYLTPRVGLGQAVQMQVPGIQRFMKTLTDPMARQQFAQRTFKFADWLKAQHPEVKTQADNLKKVVLDAIKDLNKNVQTVNGQILTGTQTEWNKISRAITDPLEIAKQVSLQQFTAIQQQAIGSLMAMGYTSSQATGIIQGMEAGKTFGQAKQAETTQEFKQTQAQGTTIGRARGGRIGGSGLQDTVPVGGGTMAAPGELIVNRHTERRVDQVLSHFGATLGGLVERENRPHSAPQTVAGITPGRRRRQPRAAGGILAGLQRGGRVPEGGSLAAAIAEANRIDAMNFAYDLGGGHVTPVPPMGPYDCSSAVSRVLQVAGWNIPTMTSGAFLNYGTPGMGPLTIAARPGEGRLGHVYLIMNGRAWGTSAETGGGGWISGYTTRPGFQYRVPPGVVAGQGARGDAAYSFGVLGGQISVPESGLPGVPGALVDAASRAYASGLGQMINARLMQMTGGAVPGGAGGTSGANQALAQQMMMQMGWGAGEWPSLQSLWMGESGFSATIANPSSGAYGIPQALPGSKMASAGADWQTNPATQIRWGLNYIRDRYGSPSSAYAAWLGRDPHWYARGGRVPEWGGWHARGGTFQATSPTLIGVGDKPETVSIRPRGTPSRGGVTITVGDINVQNYQPGDVARQIRSEVEDALVRLADDIDRLSAARDEGF